VIVIRAFSIISSGALESGWVKKVLKKSPDSVELKITGNKYDA
jgi:hypothetical protein